MHAKTEYGGKQVAMTNASLCRMYNRLPVTETSMFSSFKKVLVVASRRRRPAMTSEVCCV